MLKCSNTSKFQIVELRRERYLLGVVLPVSAWWTRDERTNAKNVPRSGVAAGEDTPRAARNVLVFYSVVRGYASLLLLPELCY